GWRRHGGALRRGCDALHEDGARVGRSAGRLYQSARHLDADRGPQGDRSDPRGLWRKMPADRGDQIAHRAFARCSRRTRGDLFAADDEFGLHLRERQYRKARSGLRGYAHCARAARQRDARLRAIELVRLRRHQRLRRVQAAGYLTMPGLMHGKRGLIMGVANDHSIAWGIAKTLAAHDAKLAFTYQGEALGKRVKPLATSVGADLVLPCDVEDLASVDAVFAELGRAWGTLDFLVHAIAFSDKSQLAGRYADTTRENFLRTMVISCFSFTEAARRAAALMPNGGAMLTLTYNGGQGG